MPENPEFKILVDITSCSLGFSGIPQDTRRNVSMLCDVANVDALAFGETHGLTFLQNSLIKRSQIDKRYVEAQQVLALKGDEITFVGKGAKFEKKLRFISRIFKRAAFLPFISRFTRQNLMRAVDHDNFVWNTYFSKTLHISNKASIDKLNLLNSSLSKADIHFKTLVGTNAKIDTSAYDFMLFSEPTVVKVSKGTQKLVRFHDCIPLTHPHLINDPLSIKYVYKVLKRCKDDGTIFICNSPYSERVLHSLFPGEKLRSYIVPCAIDGKMQKRTTHIKLEDIIRKYISFEACSNLKLKFSDKQLITKRAVKVTDDGFILHVANIDPKKNQTSLISAWDRYRNVSGKNVKLVMVSSVGWNQKPVFKKMQPHVLDGSLIHLENVSGFDLTSLMSAARGFVFPSFVEGFGLGNLEAARCNCPVIASDIEPHRYVLNDNAMFVDPFSVTDIFQKLEYLFDNKNSEYIAEKAEKAFELSEEFTSDKVKDVWKFVLNDITSNRMVETDK